MKIDTHSSSLASSTLLGRGVSAQNSHASVQATSLQGQDTADNGDDSSTIKTVEPGGEARENQGARKPSDYSQEEQKIIEQMKARDREVRAHEAAHKGAAGALAHGAAQFSYQSGPDGKQYAVGGEVSIDTSEVSGNPQATIIKAQIIYRAATAPAQPSSQDRSVAAMATQMEATARQELSQQKAEEQKSSNSES